MIHSPAVYVAQIFTKSYTLKFLKIYGYDFYFVDEIDEKITKIVKFNDNLKRPEGSNCYATFHNTK